MGIKRFLPNLKELELDISGNKLDSKQIEKFRDEYIDILGNFQKLEFRVK